MPKVKLKLDMHNAFAICDEADVERRQGVVADFMRPLLAELSKKRPSWEFIANSAGNLHPTGNGREYGNFSIEVEGESLGGVWVERHWRDGTKKFAFDNARLRKQRQRGSSTETKDLKKAVKTILANMYPTTPTEFVETARNSAASKLSTTTAAMHRAYYNARTGTLMSMENYVLDNAEALKAAMPQLVRSIDDMLSTREKSVSAAEVDKRVKGDKGTLVAARGDKYYVEPFASLGSFLCYAVDELPDRLKMGVGVLKVTEVGTLIPHIGFRADDNVFLVFDE